MAVNSGTNANLKSDLERGHDLAFCNNKSLGNINIVLQGNTQTNLKIKFPFTIYDRTSIIYQFFEI